MSTYLFLATFLNVEPWYVVLATATSGAIPLLVILVSFTMKAYSRITEVHTQMFGSRSARGSHGIVGDLADLKAAQVDVNSRLGEIEVILERWEHQDGG